MFLKSSTGGLWNSNGAAHCNAPTSFLSLFFLFLFCFVFSSSSSVFRGDEICNKYGYKVKYTGVGKGPDGTEHLGMCTQIGVFERLNRNAVKDEGEIHNLMPYIVVSG